MSPLMFRGASFDVAQNQRFSDCPSKLVIAIDLATTRACLATGQRLLNKDHKHTPPVVKLYTCWPDAYEGSRWPITAMLYDLRGIPITGNDLERVFRKVSKSASPSTRIDLNKHFRQWKLLFHDDQSDPSIKKIQDELFLKLALLGKTRLDLLRDWVKLIYKDLLIPEKDGLYSLNESIGRFDKKDIEIVVTVPPGRSVLAHDQVHEAFIQGPIGKGQVFLVSEPEAMFRSWVHSQDDPQHFQVGGRYMVVDGGGGTCCIVRFRLDKLEPTIGFEQEYESESLVCGAESISNLVEEKIASKLAQDYPNRAWILDQFRRQFDELYKSRFGADDDDIYNFNLPNLECELSRQEMVECFDICIGKLFRTMDRHLSRGLPVHFLVLGGGLFASPYVMLAVRKHFSKLIICPLSADKGHVARGGVLVRSCAPFITIAPIFRSKAVTTFVKVTDAIRNSPIFDELYTQEDDRGELWYHAAQWLTRQGTETEIKHGIERQEVESESSFKDARKRYFKMCEEDLSFSETVLTFNHTPPVNEKLIFQLNDKDGTWLTLDGQLLPQPESSEKLTWNPKEIGVDLNTLEISYDHGKAEPLRVLRYAFQMEMREVGTKYWVKTWSWTKPYKTKGRVRQILSSEPSDRKALFTRQEISRNLAVSYDLGPGMRKENNNEVTAPARVGQQSGLTDQHKGTGVPSAAQSLLNQVPHVASTFPNAPTITVQPRIGVSEAQQTTAKRNVCAAPSSHTRELLSAQWDLSRDWQSSHNPLRTARPTQRQSIEGNAEYSLGAPRNNGGKTSRFS